MRYFSGLFIVLASAAFAQTQNGDVVGCAVDTPCISSHQMQGTDLVVTWDGGGEDWSLYHVRWSRPDKPVHALETSGGREGRFIIHNARKGATYTFAASGCIKHVIGHDRCSAWSTWTFVAQ